jgi:hypothetical protein
VESQQTEQALIAEFVAAALAADRVWSLRDAEGWALAVSEENDDELVMPFWSNPEAAKQCARDEWAGFDVTEIPLDDFVDGWLPGMEEDGYYVGLEWAADATGMQIAPELLREAFENAVGGVGDESDEESDDES